MPRKSLRSNNKFELDTSSHKMGRGAEYWDAMKWKAVDVSDQNLGEFQEAVFYGLEELDGNAYLSTKNANKDTKEKEKEKKPKKKRALETEGDAAQPEEKETAVSVVEDVPMAAEKKDKKKKNKKAKLAVEETAMEVEEEKKEEVSPPAQKKQKKSSEQPAQDKASKVAQTQQDNTKPGEKQAEKQAEKQNNKQEKKQKDNKKKQKAVEVQKPKETEIADVMTVLRKEKSWGGISLSSALQEALVALDFTTPTPIQVKAIPSICKGKCDIVGVAETGSGKTLSFVLPMLNQILLHWDDCRSLKTPFALVISPTRELAMQINNVLKDITTKIRQLDPLFSAVKIETATVVGGMSEDKQRRLLSTDKKPLHVIIATPGRLIEILEDESIAAFKDLSTLKFLVVDEADRIMEDGHYSELHRVFSRIRDHEAIVQRGEDVQDVIRRRKLGIDVEETVAREEVGEPAGEEDEQQFDFPSMPSEEELAAARALPARALEEDGDEEDDEEEEEEDMEEVVQPEEEEEEVEDAMLLDEGDEEDAAEDEEGGFSEDEQTPETSKNAPVKDVHAGKKQKVKPVKSNVDMLRRQTLLFSATALEKLKAAKDKKDEKKQKKLKLMGTLSGLATNCQLPVNLKELLSIVAIQHSIQVIDVTHNNKGDLSNNSKDNKNKQSNGEEPEEEEFKLSPTEVKELLVALPKNLKQIEIRLPAEDKDMYVYYYLHKNQGRSLIFVNSIKAARRVDGLLRALGFHCRAIHGDLPQKQRFKALESFKSTPNCILVATDVAARGLDVPNIQSVIHYDIARSPQVYIHRSGRTARAFASGTTISFVTPEDSAHHQLICEHLTGKSSGGSVMQTLRVEPQFMSPLRERVKLAKKIFTQSFVAAQSSKERNWVKQSATEADLDMDDFMLEEIGAEESQKIKEKSTKAALQKARAELQVLLDTPIEGVKKRGSGNSNKPGKHQVKASDFDWRKRKNGFFVYTPPN